jgi:hypothetical protein
LLIHVSPPFIFSLFLSLSLPPYRLLKKIGLSGEPIQLTPEEQAKSKPSLSLSLPFLVPLSYSFCFDPLLSSIFPLLPSLLLPSSSFPLLVLFLSY